MHLKPFKSMQNLLKIKHPHRTPITYGKTASLKKEKKSSAVIKKMPLSTISHSLYWELLKITHNAFLKSETIHDPQLCYAIM